MKRLIIFVMVLISVFMIHAQENGANRADLIPDLMAEINLWRLSRNLEPLVYNPTLEQLAIVQADYLMQFPSIPNDIHAGANGESPRERSQYPQYAWANYGHPQLFAITEIAAIGSIESAMNFWQNSDIHTRSALNPTYREVGVAARQRGTDVLFIVVLGGQPNVLPALADPDTQEVYLTNERNDWQGDWISAVTEYRLLASNLEPLSNWLPWENRVNLPEIEEDFFYVQYQDGTNRVTSRVSVNPIWSLSDEDRAFAMAVEDAEIEAVEADEDAVDEAIAALPTGTATSTPTMTPEPSVFATSTPLPTNTPLPSPTFVIPTLTPRPIGTIRLVYDDDYLTLINTSSVFVDLYGLQFTNEAFTYNMLTWEVPADEINIGALPPNHCLQLGGFSVSNTINPLPECNFVRSFVTISEDNFFWVDGTFDIIRNGQIVATCEASANSCEIVVD